MSDQLEEEIKEQRKESLIRKLDLRKLVLKHLHRMEKREGFKDLGKDSLNRQVVMLMVANHRKNVGNDLAEGGYIQANVAAPKDGQVQVSIVYTAVHPKELIALIEDLDKYAEEHR